MEDFLKLQDLYSAELNALIDFGIELKSKLKNKEKHEYLKDKIMGMIFTKSSTRTRVAFETGIIQLGGRAIFLSSQDIQLGRGESIADTARVLERYLDLIMIRTYKQSDVEDLAKFANIPVINGLTDYCHPSQVVADLMTLKEYKGTLKGKKLCYIGDGNNVANSLIVGCIKTGVAISLACPEKYSPDPKLLAWARHEGDIELTEDIQKAVRDADALYTDVWASMGQENEAAIRQRIFKEYQINNKILQMAAKDAIVLHCLPAHKGEEISENTFEEHAKEIFDEAENRLHAHKAIMAALFIKDFGLSKKTD
ncbi:MAG: ornithine carbamoyltransferase [Christensenellaceae bacterium]|jgi:ornithine carbamoyltransferase|nr:ornithine carbamoyltransferase [Christensenellaceae bacterium]